jgi:ArsR family transcriptional regulator
MKENMVEYFKVLSDSNRLEIVELLIKGQRCGCNLLSNLSISQPTLSYHLKMLSSVGLTSVVRDGNMINHYVDKDKINEMITFLIELRDSEETSCKI